MKSTVLIATMAGDYHAFAVAEALDRKGGSVALWMTPDFPSRATESVQFGGGDANVRIGDFWYEDFGREIRSLWNRRPRHELDTSVLSTADAPFALAQCHRFRTALLELLSARVLAAGGLCVSPWNRCVLGENKLWQHHWAAEVGLAVPDTLYTNDPGEIRRMIATHGGRVVYKPFSGTVWLDSRTEWGYYTNTIEVQDLVSDDLLRAVPGIYQEVIEKEFELRVTIIGSSFFGARVNSQETAKGRLDWRRAYDDLTMEPFEMPQELEDRCGELLTRLGIVFGCLDFIVTPSGEYIFLEVNPAGQFLFVEEYSGLPLLDAFSEFLLAGRADFRWEESRNTLRLEDVQDAAAERSKKSLEEHVISRPPQVDERDFASAEAS